MDLPYTIKLKAGRNITDISPQFHKKFILNGELYIPRGDKFILDDVEVKGFITIISNHNSYRYSLSTAMFQEVGYYKSSARSTDHLMIKSLPYNPGPVFQFEVNGIQACQRYGVWSVFTKIENVNNIKRVLEIGTFTGGMTIMLSHIFFDATVHTYDINNFNFDRVFYGKNNIVYTINDVFVIEDDIGKLIREPGQTLILCDGGNKKREFNIFSKYLKPGDIIMGHDYAKDHTDFKSRVENKIWNWLELKLADISDTTKSQKLSPYMEEDCADYVLACYQK